MRVAQPAGAQQPGAAYAVLPECSAFLLCKGSDVTARAWNVDQMRAFADATHALRVASHGQAPAQEAPAAVAGPARQALIDVIAQGLSGTWHCLRVWSAWNVGTMSQDDFSPVDESDTPAELADAVLALLAAAPTAQPAPNEDEGISREQWIEQAMRVYLIAGDTEQQAEECAKYLWGELDLDDLADPYDAAMSDVEGRGPAPQPSPAAQGDALTQAARDVLAERQRQVTAEGWTPERDDEYRHGELSSAAGCYALYNWPHPTDICPVEWPWDATWWKPATYRQSLEKAGALILAELERIDRAAQKGGM